MINQKLISLFLLCNVALGIDIIQVDVGNAIDFSDGVLEMESTDKIDVTGHGTHMAVALHDELKIQRSKKVHAKQIVWDYGNPNSLLPALQESLKQEPKVLSLSYGGRYKNALEEGLIFANTLNDTVVVAAAGNERGGRVFYPANYKNPCILSVGTSESGVKAYYSNDADVWLEYNPKDPTGTSASAARMAGIVLQYRRNYPNYTCDKIVLTVRMLYGKIKK